mmetsp:Transcript_944/g.1040  ORF Transcript_944/g.1040 Transcript_944/m.1040 type:complete len:332 (-) Transcript_944:60-1055(-)
MMITHLLSPAKAIRAVLFLTTATTAVVGSTTRNIARKNEEIVVSQEHPEPHRALIGLNQMECTESLDTNDGSIVCTFRVMPPVAYSTSNNPNLIHDCLFTSGSNICVTTEIYRSTHDQANQQAASANQNPSPPLVTTVDAELSSAIVPANTSPTPPVVMPSRTETIQIPIPINGANCPSTAPSNGDTCSWVDTNMYGSYQCGYLSDTTVPQLPGTFITVCKCDSSDRFVCARAVDQMYTTIDAELSSAIITPTNPDSTIKNSDNCPSTAPSTGDTCSWVNTNKFSSYECGYLSHGNGNTSLTFIMVCQCDATDTFVCAPAANEVYSYNQSF